MPTKPRRVALGIETVWPYKHHTVVNVMAIPPCGACPACSPTMRRPAGWPPGRQTAAPPRGGPPSFACRNSVVFCRLFGKHTSARHA
jgi:hypothetical protein